MPYEVTASRKRPQTFEQLAGQEFVAATLEKSLEAGRIAHAYLFSGPRGCGKTSTARILAKALNCEKGPTGKPCGVCDSCRSINSGSSLDVIEIDGASNTSVDNVRQIKDEVLFPPNSGRYKIYIIDEVHMLSTSAFNALLKTIEEPPPYVVFMFATTEVHKVPATIKSRCQQFSFRLVSADILVELLSEAASELGVEAEREALLWIARESGGSVRDAYTLLDQVVSFSEGKLSAALIREKLGLVGQDRMNALFAGFVAGDTARSLESLDAILSGGVSAEQFISDAVEYCRALLLIGNGVAKEHLLGAPLSSFDLSVPESLGEERIERLLSIFLGSYRALKDSIDPRYELDLAVAKASHIGSYISPGDMARAVGVLRRFVEKGAPAAAQPAQAWSPAPARSPAQAPNPAPASIPAYAPRAAASPAQAQASASAPAPAEPAAPSASQPQAEQSASPSLAGVQDIAQVKKILVAEIKRSNILLGTTLDKSRFLGLDAASLGLEASSKMEYDLLKRFSGIIAEVLSQKLGSPHRVEIGMPGAHAAPGSPAGTARPRTPAASPTAFPAVQAAPAPNPEHSPAEALASPPAPMFRDGAKAGLSEREQEAVGLLGRFFKGSSISYQDAAVPKTEGASAARTSAGSGGAPASGPGRSGAAQSEPDIDEAPYQAEETEYQSADYQSLERD